MSQEQKTQLETELGELFDIRNAKLRRDRKMNEEAILAQKDIRMLMHMFSDGIPSVTIPLGDEEFLEWDAEIKKLLYHKSHISHFVEALSKENMVRIRPHLRDLVRKAKDFYRD